MIESNDSAFPYVPNEFSYGDAGLTKRELFAAMMMQGLIARVFSTDPKSAAHFAVKHADVLIEELKRIEK